MRIPRSLATSGDWGSWAVMHAGGVVTIEHYVLRCPRFYMERSVLAGHLRLLGVAPLSLPAILGGQGVPDKKRRDVVLRFCGFLSATGRLTRL